MKYIIFFLLSFCELPYLYAQHLPDSIMIIYFETNKYELNNTHIDKINSELLNKRLVVTAIKGYTDSVGSDNFNMDLSKKRALSVYSHLKNLHIVDSLFSIEFFGENHLPGSDLFYDRKVEISYKIRDSVAIPFKDSLVVPLKYETSKIYFVPDKPIIESESFPVIDDIADYLKTFHDCQFEIVGHVNYVLTEAAMKNAKALEPIQQLSEARAKLVYELLSERGIEKLNMTYKGAGNSQMYFKNPKNDEEKRKNMRVEILILCKK